MGVGLRLRLWLVRSAGPLAGVGTGEEDDGGEAEKQLHF